MTDQYWTNFWVKHGAASINSNVHTQVLRTLQKKPISENSWQNTLDFVYNQMQLTTGHQMLDLCCGNGLFSQYFDKNCERLLAVDISADLLTPLSKIPETSIKPFQADIRALELSEREFDRVLLYAALQYLNESEAVQLFENIVKWLKPGGIFYIGDIPDRNQLWEFFDDGNRKSDYFKSLNNGNAVIGTWFEPEWVYELGKYAGFSSVEIIKQPEYMIYHSYRYDAILVR